MDQTDGRERLALLAGIAASLWLVLSLPVFAQESYYWCYAQHPALSYFDHPPLGAWLIWVGTALFGDGALGIRFGTWLCGIGTILAGRALLRGFGIGAAGRTAWIVASIAVPAFAATKFLANPDPPLILCWTLTMLALWRARDGGLGWWVAAGAAAGAALLAKYTAAFLAVSGVLLLVLDPALRRQLRRPGPYLGVLVAVLVFSPVLVWNLGHDFASFRFQTEARYARAAFDLAEFGACVAQQVGMLHPAVAVLTALGLGWLLRQAWRGDPRCRWLLAFGLPLAGYLLVNALWMEVKVNWFTPAYVGLVLAVIVWWCEGGWPDRHPTAVRWVRGGLLAVWCALPATLAVPLLASGRGSSWVGWDQVAASAAAAAEGLAAEGRGVFFFGSDYKDSAQLWRNLARLETADGRRGDALGPVLAQNIHGAPALQFDQWTVPASLVGRDAVFVLASPERRAREALPRIRPVFASIERVEEVRIERLGRPVFSADVFVCRGYLGPTGH
jgi:dolichol-phosphate mannosyltransferase